MTYEQCLTFIHSLDRFGSVPGLERISELLSLLGNPQEKLKFIHVAGTNGKGSVTMYCASVLKKAGYKVGAYISPFVVDFRERIQFCGEFIGEDDLCEVMEEILPHYEDMKRRGLQITEFELITAVAFVYFKKKNCDVVCLEVGMGGRFDATNVILSPIVSVIVSISFDHVNILGDTLEKIAFEKCGIIKPTCPVVSYPEQDDDVLAVIMEQCAIKGCRLTVPNFNSVEIISSELFDTRFIYSGFEISPKLLGSHQIKNAITAVEALKIVRGAGFSISDEDISAGISDTVFPARMEILSKEPLIIVDGAHNLSGAETLKNSIEKLEVEPIIIMGMLADKDFESVVGLIAPLCEEFIAVTPNNPRKLDCKSLCEAASKFTKATYREDYTDAVEYAVSELDGNQALVVCGSLYLASDMRKIIKTFLERQ